MRKPYFEVAPGRNWLERYLIQRAQHERGSVKSVEGQRVDPLGRVKASYHDFYSGLIPPSSRSASPDILQSSFDQISTLIDTIAGKTVEYKDHRRQRLETFSGSNRLQVEQGLNKFTAVVTQGNEAIIEATIKYLAEDDPLMNYRLGRLIRNFWPSRARRELLDLNDKIKAELKLASKEATEDSERKFRR